MPAYRVAAFQTFFSGRISTFGDTEGIDVLVMGTVAWRYSRDAHW
jgi:hypothetical protein